MNRNRKLEILEFADSVLASFNQKKSRKVRTVVKRAHREYNDSMRAEWNRDNPDIGRFDFAGELHFRPDHLERVTEHYGGTPQYLYQFYERVQDPEASKGC